MDDFEVTPLYDLHTRMAPFAGYALPVQYPTGVMEEHLHCRAAAGLFDVSHMGQVLIDGPDWQTVAYGFERLVPQDVMGLKRGRQRYGFFTTESGGIADDLMFARRGNGLFVVVNAACRSSDLDLMRAGLPQELSVALVSDRALVALQGPGAEDVLSEFDPTCRDMRSIDLQNLKINGQDVWASRSGYTGEDGFELSMPSEQADEICTALLANEGVKLIGLGARDSSRLEAGPCLYGQDIDVDTTPAEAALAWAVPLVRRTGGARAGGFPGEARILAQLDTEVPRKRVGLRPNGRAPMRPGVSLFASETATDPVGQITSGGFGPTVGGPVSMGCVAADESEPGTILWGEVRGKRLAATVSPLPFTPANFKRK